MALTAWRHQQCFGEEGGEVTFGLVSFAVAQSNIQHGVQTRIRLPMCFMFFKEQSL